MTKRVVQFSIGIYPYSFHMFLLQPSEEKTPHPSLDVHASHLGSVVYNPYIPHIIPYTHIYIHIYIYILCTCIPHQLLPNIDVHTSCVHIHTHILYYYICINLCSFYTKVMLIKGEPASWSYEVRVSESHDRDIFWPSNCHEKEHLRPSDIQIGAHDQANHWSVHVRPKMVGTVPLFPS